MLISRRYANRGIEKLKYLIDTNILVDALRLKSEAIVFLENLHGEKFVSSVTMAEIFAGVRSDKQRNNALKLFSVLQTQDFMKAHAEQAGNYISKFGRSHAVVFADAAIAATAYVENLELITRNRKHFPMFKALRKPY
jgi:predicted nucleic acid-binding protein